MREELADPFEGCINGEQAPCQCACPFPFDLRAFVEKVQRGSFGAAFNLYRNAVVFPGIVARICPAPCAGACAKVFPGEPISLPLLERGAMDHARATDPINFNIPRKGERIAVIGSDLSGLSCALGLAEKGYGVSVYEREGVIASSLEKHLSREVFEAEIRKQFQFVDCDFKMNEEVHSISQLEADAIYVSAEGEIEGDDERVFRSPQSLEPMDAIARGSRSVAAIEWYLQTGGRKAEGTRATAGKPPLFRQSQAASSAVKPGDGMAYTKAEARSEAERCLRCDCSACLQECVLLRKHGALPKTLAKEVGLALNLFPETQGRAAMREIGACNFCGLCEKICPAHVDIGRFLLKARMELFKLGTLPPAHHEYWLRDMAFSNSQEAALFYRPEPHKDVSYLFFPGCQAGGSDPRYVSRTYARLLERWPEMGLLLRCCGAPALWAGDQGAFHQELAQIKRIWEEAGRPTMILSCPSCFRLFHEYEPEIPLRSVYELLHPQEGMRAPLTEAAVFDPCASRQFPQMQAAVRRVAGEYGIQLEELRNSGERAQCCSWGGHGYSVNPVFVETLAREQAEQSPLPYIVYCSNCRDVFSGQGKDCRHVLDLILGINDEMRRPPTATERRDRRRRLKRELVATYTPGQPPPETKRRKRLKSSEAMARKISDALILDEDISTVIEDCEERGTFILDRESGRRIGHGRLGLLTYWVVYEELDDGSYRIHNAYSHRMAIKGE